MCFKRWKNSRKYLVSISKISQKQRRASKVFNRIEMSEQQDPQLKLDLSQGGQSQVKHIEVNLRFFNQIKVQDLQ